MQANEALEPVRFSDKISRLTGWTLGIQGRIWAARCSALATGAAGAFGSAAGRAVSSQFRILLVVEVVVVR